MRKACFWLLVPILALVLCACSKPTGASIPTAAPNPTPDLPAATEQATAAPDWRAEGGFMPATVGGDEKVLYRLESTSLAAYRAAGAQEAVLRLELSATGDPAYVVKNLAFVDKNDDGYNDLCLPLPDNGGLLFYLWDMDAKKFSVAPLAAEGLWLTIGSWPDNAILRSAEGSERGTASFTWCIPGDGPAFVLERLPSAKPGRKAVCAEVAGFESLPVSAVKISEDEELSARLTYPAYRLTYHAEGDGGFLNDDVYVQTDGWDFRLHIVTQQELKEKYAGQIESWLSSLIFQDTSAVTAD